MHEFSTRLTTDCFHGGMQNNHPPPKVSGPVVSRLADVMAPTYRFSFKGVSRMAEAAGVSHASVSRLVAGHRNASFITVARVTSALEAELGIALDPRDLIAESGRFLTPYCCVLVHCGGCLPANACGEDGRVTREYAGIRSGAWVSSRYPAGFLQEKGDA